MTTVFFYKFGLLYRLENHCRNNFICIEAIKTISQDFEFTRNRPSLKYEKQINILYNFKPCHLINDFWIWD